MPEDEKLLDSDLVRRAELDFVALLAYLDFAWKRRGSGSIPALAGPTPSRPPRLALTTDRAGQIQCILERQVSPKPWHPRKAVATTRGDI